MPIKISTSYFGSARRRSPSGESPEGVSYNLPIHFYQTGVSMLKVGYIGLGLMGKSIVRNILKAGFPLVVHNRSRAAVDELVAEGATAASSPREVAAQVDIVFTNLPDTPDVEKV